MKTLKSIPYILVGFTAMSFVAFITMSVVVLHDMAEQKGEAAGAMQVLLSVPIKQLGSIQVRI